MNHPPRTRRTLFTEDDARRARRYAAELARRQKESLRLYEPLEHIRPFHESHAPERVLRGSNRGGKTLGAAVEFAFAVTGQDPHKKYPTSNGRAFIVGKDGKHNSEVLYRKLFRSGAFKIIYDKQLKRWRTYKPWDDKGLEKEAKDAPPLIPPRLVKSTAWENKKEGLPNVVVLQNGWEIRFFSSLGKPPQGSDIDVAWFDEEIVDPEWYSEISARLIDRRGKFIWSATAQLGGEQLYDLCEQAAVEREKAEPRVVEFFAHIDANRHFTNEQRHLFFSKLSEEQRRIRIEGEFAFTSFKVYPEFQWSVHGADYFHIPDNWTRYMVVDPGRQVCGVIFAAVPHPSTEQDYVYIYDELYLKNCDARKFGLAVKEKVKHHIFQAFLIDHHGARITEQGSGRTVEMQYSEALKDHNIYSDRTGHDFIWGSDDVDGGILAFRSWLTIRPNDTPRLKVFKGCLPNFDWEVKRYHYKRDRGRLTDKPEQKHNHLMDCCRYLAMYDPQWHPPRKRPRKATGALAALKAKLERQRLREEGTSGGVRLGPGNYANV